MTRIREEDRAMLCIVRIMLLQDVCLSVRLSHTGIVSKWLNISRNFFTERHDKIPMGKYTAKLS